jgi:hypothetical protein
MCGSAMTARIDPSSGLRQSLHDPIHPISEIGRNPHSRDLTLLATLPLMYEKIYSRDDYGSQGGAQYRPKRLL